MRKLWLHSLFWFTTSRLALIFYELIGRHYVMQTNFFRGSQSLSELRHSRLFEATEDLYRFDAVLGTKFSLKSFSWHISFDIDLETQALCFCYCSKSLICIPLSLTQVGLVTEVHFPPRLRSYTYNAPGKFGQCLI